MRNGANVTDDDLERVNELFPEVYACLHELARRWFEREATGHTLQPTALVNEAYIRLAQSERVAVRDRAHFVATAARVMRHILVDHVRGRRALKRGGGAIALTLMDFGDDDGDHVADVIDVDAALRRLAVESERPAQVVELRFFGGLSVDETALALGVSPRTVNLDWRFARAWLMRELQTGGA